MPKEKYNGRTAEQILSSLLRNHFYTGHSSHGFIWSYVEDTSLGEVDESLEKSCLEFERKYINAKRTINKARAEQTA